MFSDHKSLKYIFIQRNLNKRQRIWIEYLEDYDFTLHYHPGKPNVVANALSRKSWGVLASAASWEWQMIETMGQFKLRYSDQVQVTKAGPCIQMVVFSIGVGLWFLDWQI